MMKLLRLFLFLFGILLVIITVAVSAARSQNGTHAMMAYTAPEGIVKAWADGRAIDTLAPAGSSLPAWSPDGRWIVYTHAVSPTQDELRIMRSGGGRYHALSGIDLEYPLAVRWSPDSTRFLATGRDRLGQKVYAVTPYEPVSTPFLTVSGNHRLPSWSPDGRAFVLAVTRGEQLVIYRADAAEAQPITSLDAINYDPQWTKDGAWIIYTASNQENIDLYRMHPDGSAVERLTHGHEPEHYPNLSPDGQWVLYLVNRGVETLPYLMLPDGSAAHALSDHWNVPVPLDIAWSPDSQWIAFTEAGGLYRIRVDGRGIQQLTRRDTCCVSWSPLLEAKLHSAALLVMGVVCIGGAAVIKAQDRRHKAQ